MMIKIINGYTFWEPENGSVTENLNCPWIFPSMITPPGLLKQMQDNNSTIMIVFYTQPPCPLPTPAPPPLMSYQQVKMYCLKIYLSAGIMPPP